MLLQKEHARIDEQTMELIAAHITAALREDLEAILAELGQSIAHAPALTVDQVARRLGVSRSTVYTHWREWGGYKLGNSEKAPIRFDGNHLPLTPHSPPEPRTAASPGPRPRRRRRELITDAPRFAARPGSQA
ncbi:MAG: helix-turn-helix domain-containing protein [Pseudonocardiaceae bacterium]